jgi:hypothetical protein
MGTAGTTGSGSMSPRTASTATTSGRAGGPGRGRSRTPRAGSAGSPPGPTRPPGSAWRAPGRTAGGWPTTSTPPGGHVAVVNPARVKYAALMRGQGNKTDPADARAIATFCRDRRPRLWAPPSPEVRQLQALVRRRDDLRAMAAGEKNRLAVPNLTPAARRSIARTVKFLTREADRVQAEAEALVADTPARRKLIMLCYGVLKNRRPFDTEWASRITR